MKYWGNDFFNCIKQDVFSLSYELYDYFYIDSKVKHALAIMPEVISIGNSHSTYGYSEQHSRYKSMNFSLPSMDLFYSFEMLKSLTSSTEHHVKYALITSGYYMLYHDLSKVKRFQRLIPLQFYPMFKQKHNYDGPMEKKYLAFRPSEANIPEDTLFTLCDSFCRNVIAENNYSYFGNFRRYDDNLLKHQSGITSWSTGSESDREGWAKERAEENNRLYMHTATAVEYKEILSNMLEYCSDKGIIPIIVIYPFDTDYLKYLNPNYKRELIDYLDGLSYPVNIFDMNDLEGIFETADFKDADHLNEQGAIKATTCIDEFIAMITENN